MTTDLYPHIDPAMINVLKLVQQMADNDPTYLESDDCPYPAPVKAFFQKKIDAKRVMVSKEGPIDLEDEAASLYQTLKEFGKDLTTGEGMDTKEYMAWIKTVVQMQEKLLMIAERAKSVKWVKLFEAAVFSMLEDLPPEVRTTCIDKLKKVSG